MNKIKMKFNLTTSDVKYLYILVHSNQYSMHFALREWQALLNYRWFKMFKEISKNLLNGD